VTLNTSSAAADISAAVFNNRYFSSVVVAIGDRPDFTAREIARTLELSDSLVRPVIQRLLNAGLIQELTRDSRSRSTRRMQKSSESPWEELYRLCQSLTSA